MRVEQEKAEEAEKMNLKQTKPDMAGESDRSWFLLSLLPPVESLPHLNHHGLNRSKQG